MIKSLILVIAIISVWIGGCAANTKPTENLIIGGTPAANPLKNTRWQVESYGAADSRQQIVRPPTQSSEPLVEFGETTLGGRVAGCNTISFDYAADGSKFTVKNLATTVMGCSKEILVQEQELIKALEKANEFRLNENELDIVCDDGKFIRLKRAKGETK